MNLTWLQVLPLFLTLSCSGPTGLIKTQFKDWEIQDFNSMGLQLELPKKPIGVTGGYLLKEYTSTKAESGLGYKEIKISLNPVWKGDYLLEPFYLMNILVARLTKENYSKYKQGKHQLGSHAIFQEEYANFHSAIKTFKLEKAGSEGQKKDNLLIIRKDYLAPNGDYVLCGASLYAGPEEYIPPDSEDINAVEKVLNSVRFLNEK